LRRAGDVGVLVPVIGRLRRTFSALTPGEERPKILKLSPPNSTPPENSPLLAKLWSSALFGLEAFPVLVEADVGTGLAGFSTVGLPDMAIRESRERIVSALRNSGYEFPLRRITINLAPADRRKEGSAFDLPVALGILAASGQLPARRLDEFLILGELSLDGALRPRRAGAGAGRGRPGAGAGAPARAERARGGAARRGEGLRREYAGGSRRGDLEPRGS
jgi:hypothetical protein